MDEEVLDELLVFLPIVVLGGGWLLVPHEEVAVLLEGLAVCMDRLDGFCPYGLVLVEDSGTNPNPVAVPLA
jgi:hypothetical protein